MISRHLFLAACALALACTNSLASDDASAVRPSLDAMHAPPGVSWDQVVLGDRIFHGEHAGGRCSQCHGWDAKGTPNGNDLTVGMWIWSDGSVAQLKRTIVHNMSVAPGMDGELTPADVDAVAAYVWALGHQKRP